MASIKKHLAERIEQARDFYVKDFDALDEGDRSKSLGGVARVPYDFTFEVSFVNRRVAKRLRGEDPGPFNMEGWMKAPEEFRTKKAAMDEFTSSTNEVLEGWNGLPEADIEKVIQLSGDNTTTPLDLVNLCASHITYHDAQLNFIQTLVGDDEMHWD